MAGRNNDQLGRRALLTGLTGLAGMAAWPAHATAKLKFADLYASWGVTGLKFSPQALALDGVLTTMEGFMAPPIKAMADFFVLTREPLSMCPFCSSDAEWPPDIVVAYLAHDAQPTAPNEVIAVTGRLELGSWADPVSGFVSQARLREARVQFVG